MDLESMRQRERTMVDHEPTVWLNAQQDVIICEKLHGRWRKMHCQNCDWCKTCGEVPSPAIEFLFDAVINDLYRVMDMTGDDLSSEFYNRCGGKVVR